MTIVKDKTIAIRFIDNVIMKIHLAKTEQISRYFWRMVQPRLYVKRNHSVN